MKTKKLDLFLISAIIGLLCSPGIQKTRKIYASPEKINAIQLEGRLNNGKYFTKLGFKTELSQANSNLAVTFKDVSATATSYNYTGYLNYTCDFNSSSSTVINSYMYSPFIISNNEITNFSASLPSTWQYRYSLFQQYNFSTSKLYNFGNTFYLYQLTIVSPNNEIQSPLLYNKHARQLNFNIDFNANNKNTLLAMGIATFTISNYGEIYEYNNNQFISANENSILYETIKSSYYSLLGNVTNAYGAYLDAYLLFLNDKLTNININQESYNQGFTDGYNNGLEEGKAQAQAEIQADTFNTSWLTSIFNSIINLFNIEIFNGFKIWYALGIPLFLSFIFLILKFFR